MRTCLDPVCEHMPGHAAPRRQAAAAHAASGTPAASRLTFSANPLFSPDIPGVIAPSSNLRLEGALAQYLLQAGLINARTFSRDCASIHEVCHSALNAWLKATTGELRCFTPHFELQLLDHPDKPCNGQPREGLGLRQHAGTVQICWREAAVCHWGVGTGLDYLEQCVPQLGATVLDALERKGSQAYPLFTPGVALDEASYLYWRGENDENLMLDEECGDDLAARQAMTNDMVTRAAIDAAFPPWALDYSRARLPVTALARIGSCHPCAYVRRGALLARTLLGLRTTAAYFPELDGDFTGFGAVLCWHDGDLAVQISDDFANTAWQGDYCEEIGTVTLALDEPAAMRRWMRQMRPNLSAIGTLDRLLWHLAERE